MAEALAQRVDADNHAGRIGVAQVVTGGATVGHPDGSRHALAAGDPVYQGDVIETTDGRVNIVFIDRSTFSLGPKGRMVLDEMVYDPAGQSGHSSVAVAKGAFTFVSGQIAKTAPNAMTVKTPVMTIGVRGTSVAGYAAAEGEQNQVTLLQDADGGVGQVLVFNAGGIQVLNQANLTLQVSSYIAPPSQPIALSPSALTSLYGALLDIQPNPPSPGPSIPTPHNDDSGRLDAPSSPAANGDSVAFLSNSQVTAWAGEAFVASLPDILQLGESSGIFSYFRSSSADSTGTEQSGTQQETNRETQTTTSVGRTTLDYSDATDAVTVSLSAKTVQVGTQIDSFSGLVTVIGASQYGNLFEGGGGSGHSLIGGDDDDLFRLVASESVSFDGGAGTDTLALLGVAANTNATLNLVSSGSLYRNIEVVDLSGSGGNVLMVDGDFLADGTGAGTLAVRGESGDTVSVSSGDWFFAEDGRFLLDSLELDVEQDVVARFATLTVSGDDVDASTGTITAQNLMVSDATLSVDGVSLTVADGSISADGVLEVLQDGLTVNGTLTARGSLDLQAGTVSGTGTLVNTGYQSWLARGQTIETDLVNAASGLIEISNSDDDTSVPFVITGSFVNHGDFALVADPDNRSGTLSLSLDGGTLINASDGYMAWGTRSSGAEVDIRVSGNVDNEGTLVLGRAVTVDNDGATFSTTGTLDLTNSNGGLTLTASGGGHAVLSGTILGNSTIYLTGTQQVDLADTLNVITAASAVTLDMLNGAVTIGSAGSGGTLVNNGTLGLNFAGNDDTIWVDLVNNGTLSLASWNPAGADISLTIAGDLTNTGTLSLQGGGNAYAVTLDLGEGTFTNTATGTVSITGTANGSETVTISADIHNAGTLTVAQTSLLGRAGGEVENSGLIDLDPSATLTLIGDRVVNSGTLDVEGGAVLTLQADDISNSGTITGQGDIVLKTSDALEGTLENIGTISVGDSSGTAATLTVYGNVVNDGGTLAFDIQGDLGEYYSNDQLHVAELGDLGQASVSLSSGTIQLDLVDYLLTGDASFTLITTDNTSSTEGGVTFSLVYEGIVLDDWLLDGDWVGSSFVVSASASASVLSSTFDANTDFLDSANWNSQVLEDGDYVIALPVSSNTTLTVSTQSADLDAVVGYGTLYIHDDGLLSTGIGLWAIDEDGDGVADDGAVIIENGGTLKTSGYFTNLGRLFLTSGTLTGGGTFSQRGTFSITGSNVLGLSLLLASSGTLNSATLTSAGGDNAGHVIVDSGESGVTATGTLTVLPDLTLTSGYLSLDPSADHANISGENLVVDITGDVGIASGATLLLTNSDASDGGEATLSLAGHTLTNAGTVSSQSSDTASTDAHAIIAALFANSGTLLVAEDLSISGSLTNTGTIELSSSATLSLDHDFTNTGTLYGQGTFEMSGHTLTNDGVMEPYTSFNDGIGTLTVDGHLVLGSSSVLTMVALSDIGTDQIVVENGVLTYGGTLDLSTSAVQDGTILTVLTADAVDGDSSFSDLSLTTDSDDTVLDPTFTDTGLTVTVQAASAPSAGAANYVHGTSGDDTILGLADTIGDVLVGGDGNDDVSITFSELTADNSGYQQDLHYLDGGAGTDVVRLLGSASVDFSQLRDDIIQRIEALVLDGTDGSGNSLAQTITLDTSSVLGMTEGENALTHTDNSLVIGGTGDDDVVILDGFTAGDTVTLSGVSGHEDSYTQYSKVDEATGTTVVVYVEQGVHVQTA